MCVIVCTRSSRWRGLFERGLGVGEGKHGSARLFWGFRLLQRGNTEKDQILLEEELLRRKIHLEKV